MKNRRSIGIFSIAIVIALTSCNGEYEIIGKSETIPEGQTIFLQRQSDEKFEIIDSATVNNGTFFFKGVQHNPAIAILVPSDNRKSQLPPLLLALEEGRIYVTLDSVSHISGTPLNDRLQKYESKRRLYDTRIQAITSRYLKDYLSGQLSDTAFYAWKKSFEKEQKGLETLTRNYILANTDNVTSVYLFLQNSFLFTPEEQRNLIARAAPSFRNNPAIEKISRMLQSMKNVEPGMPYIDLSLQTPEGESASLSEYIGHGKYVLLDFWASWCSPCRKQTPYLKQLYERYGQQAFSIIGISFDTNRDEWLEYIRENQIAWPQLGDLSGWDSSAIPTYAIQGIPHLVLIAPNGKIIANNPSEKQLNEILTSRLSPRKTAYTGSQKKDFHKKAFSN